MEYRHYLINNATNYIQNNQNNLLCRSNKINFHNISNNINNNINNNDNNSIFPVVFNTPLDDPLPHNSDLKNIFLKEYNNNLNKFSPEIKIL